MPAPHRLDVHRGLDGFGQGGHRYDPPTARAVPVDLGVARAQVQRPDLALGLELLTLGVRGRELDERGRARRVVPDARELGVIERRELVAVGGDAVAGQQQLVGAGLELGDELGRMTHLVVGHALHAARHRSVGRAEHLVPAGVEHRDDEAVGMAQRIGRRGRGWARRPPVCATPAP